ncbi:coiled-coil domain-containing protein 73 isoform X1, partial [Clarias magur]
CSVQQQMEFSTDHSESEIDLECHNYELESSDIVPDSESGIISVQLLEFKTCLLEAVEELHIHRDAETRHEAQICTLVLEKQELEWQKESLQNQINRMTKEQSESLDAVKKQFQAQIQGIELDKGKHQLSAELKDKEITSLKEELKSLQLFKYSLEKKLCELEQKVQLQTLAKDSHLNQLGEVEKRFRTISRQCAVVRQGHEILEQNVEEAMRINKKLVSINTKQESTIAALKKDVERLNSELAKSKVMSIYNSGDKSANYLLKKQQLQELKQRLIMETELNKKYRNEIAVERAEKQELMSSLQHTQCLLQTQTQAVIRTEQQLLKHTEEYQVLKREHEMVRERSKEKEDRLAHLIDDYKHSKIAAEKEMQGLHAKMQADQEELKAVKKAYDHLQEKHQQLSSCTTHQARHMQGLETGLKDDFDIQTNSPTSQNRDMDVHKDASLDGEARQTSSQDNCEKMSHCEEDEDIPDESTAKCQEAALGSENDEVNVRSQTDRTTLALPPSEGLDALAPDQSETSERVGGTDVTNQQINPAVKQESSVSESAPVLSVLDNGHPSNTVRSYTESCLAKLSEPQTRSVYGVASDPVMSEPRVTPAEKRLCVYEKRECQTPDKHTSETSQNVNMKGAETVAPEIKKAPSASPNRDSKPCVNEPVIVVELDTEPAQTPMKYRQLGLCNSSPQQQIIPKESDCSFVAPISDKSFSELQGSPDQQDTLEVINSNTGVTEGKWIPETELDTISRPVESSSQCTVFITANTAEALDGNKPDDIWTYALSAPNHEQNVEAFPHPQISIPQEDFVYTDTKLNQHLNNAEKQIIGIEPGCGDESGGYESSFGSDVSSTETSHAQLTSQTGTVAQTKKFLALSSGLVSERSVLPSGFQDLLRSWGTPVFPKSTPSNRGGPYDKANASDIQKLDRYSEWNAIKETFSEISAEKESRIPISFGSAQSGSPAVCSVGNGLRQNCTVTPPPRRHSLGKVSQAVCEERTPTPLEKQDHQTSDIRAQIAKIEQFLSSESFRPQKR